MMLIITLLHWFSATLCAAALILAVTMIIQRGRASFIALNLICALSMGMTFVSTGFMAKTQRELEAMR